MTDRRSLLTEAIRELAAGGVASPEHDAAELLAHVLGTTRGQLPLVDEVSPAAAEQYAGLVRRRAAREPLQHLTGRAYFRHVELAVGPGVFVPRPETELLAGWAIEHARRPRRPDRRRPRDRVRRHRARDRHRGPARDRVRRRAGPGRPRLGGAQPRGLRRRAAPRRPRDGVRRADRRGRRDHLQPAVHPAGGVGVGGSRGARPRPAPRVVLRARTASTRSGCSSSAPRRCCGPGEWSAWSTPTRRASRRRRCSPPRAGGPRSATTATWRAVRVS